MQRTSDNRRRGRLTILLAVAAIALVGASVAAAESAYYGYNYLSTSIPSSCGYAGCASSGSNYWDWDGMHKNSGDCVNLGFADTSGFLYFGGGFCSGYNGSNFHITRTSVGAPNYNYGLCQYESGSSSYVQCWTEIF